MAETVVTSFLLTSHELRFTWDFLSKAVSVLRSQRVPAVAVLQR